MPYVNIPEKFEVEYGCKHEAMALVVNSIAFEEASLAKLIDAQSKELNYVTQVYSHNTQNINNIKDIIDINQSINNILGKIIQVNVLEQLVLKNMLDIFASEDSTGTVSDAPVYIMPSDIAAAVPDIKQTGIKPADKCASDIAAAVPGVKTVDSKPGGEICTFKGRAVGNVQCNRDYFYKGISIFQGGICLKPGNIVENFLCYSVHKGTSMEIMNALPQSLKIECFILNNSKKIEIRGDGKIIRKERFQPDNIDICSFELNVTYIDIAVDDCSFEMIIKSGNNACFDHYSGKVKTTYSKLEVGC